ncbi:hypothetical protein MTR67_026851 [Solanum verrucosum]|uniref:Uncharacterized protein n=1 Tax=Solanum verrucosum TaxID=315347 RepID=A0AAF0R1A3_SOLVR|nr:hypothetical protein MTR67_026851 [Solanum verrucosum]
MGKLKEKATPMETNLKLKKDEGQTLKDAMKFHQLVGSLIYLTITRPEICYSVGVVSQFMHSPTTSHLDATKRISRYVNGSLCHGLWYKSTGSAVVSWCSKKQDVVALSTTEAEYIAATMAAQECIWLKRMIKDMSHKVDYAVKIKCDNESAIKLARQIKFFMLERSILDPTSFVREKVLSEEIELTIIRTKTQVVDIFTKALEKSKFQYF